MQLRPLGTTDIQISPIGLGCWQFSQGRGVVGSVWPTLDPQVMDDIVGTALAGGINWFDTAEVYGGGNSERALAGALGRREVRAGDAVIATKWWPALRTAAHLERSFPQRLEALAPYPVDLLQIHQPLSVSSVEKQARALASLLKAKKIRAAGISNFGAAPLRTFHKILTAEGFTLASNQVRYSLADRSIEADGTLEAARELGVTIIAYSPLGQGLLSGRFHDDPQAAAAVNGFRKLRSGINPKGLKQSEPLIRALQAIGQRHGVSASQVALNWLVTHHGHTVVAIPGATKVRHAEEAAGALAFTLTEGEHADIELLARF